MHQISTNAEVEKRISQQLRDQLGPSVMNLLQDDEVFEVMTNGDGHVWTDSMEGKRDSGVEMTYQQRMAFLGTIASLGGEELNSKTPIIDGLLPWDGSRISWRIPPVDIVGPSFNIRKKALKVFTLDEYVAQGRMTASEKELICRAVREKQNMLIAGPTGSGKTTFTNAILHALYEIEPHARLFTMENVPELQIMHKDCVRLQTTDTVDLQALVRNAMRGSPNRIIIGEVRDGAAHDLLKSWNKGTTKGKQ